MKFKKLMLIILAALFCISMCGCDSLERIFGSSDPYYDNYGYDNYGYNDPYADNKYYSVAPQLASHYIDVGQGDCEFVEFPDGKTMLIDAGPADSADKVISYIERLGYSSIDYVVATHPHTDHIGGMKKVIEHFRIGTVYMPDAESNTSTYSSLLKAIDKKGKKIKKAKAGTKIYSGSTSQLKVQTLAPVMDSYDSLNNYSVVIKITYGKVRLLYMGDAERESEEQMIKKNYDLSADIIKVGHHGSSTSSSQSFVKKVNAQFAIISVGENNDYHHPHNQVVNRWIKSGAEIIRTDECGDIVVTTDGDEFGIDTEKGG